MGRGLRGCPGGSRGTGRGGAVRAGVGRRASVCGREREGGGGEQLPVDQQRDCGSACTGRSSRARVRRRGRPGHVDARQGGGRGRDDRRRPDARAGRGRVRAHAEHDADRLLGERDPVPAEPVQLGPRVQGRLRVHGHQRRLRRDRHQGPGEAEAGPPQQELHDLAGRRRRLREHPRALVGLRDQRRRRRDAVLRWHARRPGLRGRPHLRHHRPDEPRHGRRRQQPRRRQAGPALLHPGRAAQGLRLAHRHGRPVARPTTRSTSTTAARPARARGWTS